nr:MAG TPA: hypothetical protein [Crassvirales sp.]
MSVFPDCQPVLHSFYGWYSLTLSQLCFGAIHFLTH